MLNVNTKFKVMLFSHISDPARMSGAEKWLLFIAKNLIKRYEVILVVPSNGMLSIEAEARGIRVVIQDYPLLWSLYESSPVMHQELLNQKSSDTYRLILDLLHMHRPDWVIVNTSVNVLPAAAAKEIGIPVAWIINEILYTSEHQIEAVKIINHYAEWIIGISESVLSPFNIPLVGNKTRLISPSWNEADLHPERWEEHRRSFRAGYHISDQEILIGIVSAILSPHKGIHQFIQMAGILMSQFPLVKFLVTGNSESSYLADYFEQCKVLVSDTLDPSRIIFHPFENRIEQVYPVLDAVVVPSLIDEGFGMTALEGMIFGKPVVAYASGGLGEVLRNTGNGDLLVVKGDVSGLSQVVTNLLQDREH
ncbi:MAG TPA: glycosyltransferase family 4 protein, partial [Paenibacillus sp.]